MIYRTNLQMDGKKRDLAMFNLAIGSKLGGCDVVHIKVEDIAPRGLTADRACVRQRKTGRPVKFALTEQTREAVDAYLKVKQKHLGDFLFESRSQPDRCISTRQYSRLVLGWIAGIGLDPRRRSRSGVSALPADGDVLCRGGKVSFVPFADISHRECDRAHTAGVEMMDSPLLSSI